MNELTMTRKQQNDFEARFFDFLQEKLSGHDKTLERLEAKIDANTALTLETKNQAERTNGRVTKLERITEKLLQWKERLARKTPDPKDLPPFWQDPFIRKAIALGFLALIIGATGVNLAGLL